MYGLAYGRELADMTQEELAVKVGLKRQSINNWERDGKVPEARLNEFEEILNIPLEFITKKLTKIDKLMIEKYRLEKELETFEEKINFPITDASGNFVADSQIVYKNENVNQIFKRINEIEEEIRSLELLQNIKDNMKKSDLNKYIYRVINELVENKAINKNLLVIVLDAIKMASLKKGTSDLSLNRLINYIDELDFEYKERIQHFKNEGIKNPRGF